MSSTTSAAQWVAGQRGSAPRMRHEFVDVPHDQRLDLMRRSGLLDRHEDDALDMLAELTRELMGVDTALVSIVGDDRQVFRGAAGLRGDVALSRQTDLDSSYCKFPVATGEAFAVRDARESALLRESPAISDLGAISYLGVPLHVRDGTVLGALCVFNEAARDWSSDDHKRLGRLADLARSELERQIYSRQVHDLMTLAERLEEPMSRLGHTVRTVASLAEQPGDPRLPRVADLNLERLRGIEALTDDLLSVVRRGRAVEDSLGTLDVVGELRRVIALASSTARCGDLEDHLPDHVVAVEAKARALSRGLAFAITTLLHFVTNDRVTVTLSRPTPADPLATQSHVTVTMTTDHTELPVGELLRVAGRLSAARGEEPALDLRYTDGSVRVRSVDVTATTGPGGTCLELRMVAAGPR